jgi:RNA polymerase sigma-70 factor (ECF subfamily)
MRSVRSARESQFEVVYRECLRDVKTYACSHVGRGDADDVVSATFMSVWQRLDEVPWPSRRAWVLGVCRNHCRNRWRTDRRFAALVDEITTVRPPSAGEPGGADTDVTSAVALLLPLLSVDDRELLVLTAWLELTPAEIAEVLGVPAGRVRVRLHRLRGVLGQHLGDVEKGGLA